jgi:hypothetical protein
MKTVLKVAVAILALCVIFGVGYVSWRSRLPSDERAGVYFKTHRQELAALVATVEREPRLNFVNADWIGNGSDATDPAHVACAKLLKKVGAQFLRKGDGAIEIYFWGDGCAICHDSYKGYVFIRPGARILEYATTVQSLEDKALPKP